jgi:hypothetical protein
MATRAILDPELADRRSAWLAIFRQLSQARDAANWALVDWIGSGRQDGTRVTSAEIAKALDLSRVRVCNHVRLADAFPPDRRDLRLSFDVHAHLACLPDETRLETLAIAAAEGWGERKARAAAVAFRQERAGFEDEDKDDQQAVHIMRAWNRASPAARGYFTGLQEVSGLGVVDEETACA